MSDTKDVVKPQNFSNRKQTGLQDLIPDDVMSCWDQKAGYVCHMYDGCINSTLHVKTKNVCIISVDLIFQVCWKMMSIQKYSV